jgi:hypothetical protein
MTPQELRIAIAEFDGWLHTPEDDNAGVSEAWVKAGSPDLFRNRPPDYPYERDAMCSVIGKLTQRQMEEYARHLQDGMLVFCVGVVPDYYRDLKNLAKLTIAEPLHMATAFVKAIGKWNT